MFRVLKWATPFVAFAFLLSLTIAVRADEAKKETGSVSGTVLDKEGKPAAGVQVRLFHPFERGQRRGNGSAAKVEKQNADSGAAATADKEEKPGKGEKGHGGKGNRPQPVATTSTDNDGHFTLSDVPAGKYVVMAMVKGVGGAREDVTVTSGSEAKIEMKLKDRPARGDRAEKKAEKKGEKKTDGATE
jgi:Carboxypeptidase regulatory-like domain